MTRTPFSLESYAERLRRTASKYPIVGFEVLDEADLPAGFCIVRHDIDFDPEAALAIARIEAEQGIRSTYSVLLTGPFYNPFEKHLRQQLQAVAALGHAMALHFDATGHDITDESSLETKVRAEADALADLLDVEIASFAFHNTTPFTMSCRARRYAGLWNAYAQVLQDEVSYVSDSNGHWRFRDWDEALEEQPARLQVLTHPEWWVEAGRPPAETVCTIVEERSDQIWSDFVNLLRQADRRIISADPVAQEILIELGELDVLKEWFSGCREGAYFKLIRAIAVERSARGVPEGSGDPLVHRLLEGAVVAPEELSEAFSDAATSLASIRARPGSRPK